MPKMCEQEEACGDSCHSYPVNIVHRTIFDNGCDLSKGAQSKGVEMWKGLLVGSWPNAKNEKVGILFFLQTKDTQHTDVSEPKNMYTFMDVVC